jgi:hypothetical protein
MRHVCFRFPLDSETARRAKQECLPRYRRDMQLWMQREWADAPLIPRQAA